MLGCKYERYPVRHIEAQRINRYMLECKLCEFGSIAIINVELIDTCWDVNLTGKPATSPRLAGINRYMLECKCA